jgi:pimeloyl-[acyl-carrier protein] methyl ester esterase
VTIPEVSLVLLPGLDGTARLFDRFAQAAPPTVSVTRVPLPRDRVVSYDALATLTRSSLPQGRVILLGESFSGPLALRLAALVQPLGVILCASFIRASAPLRLSAAPLSALLKTTPPPVSVVKALFAGGDEALAAELVRAILTVDREVIAARIRMVLEVDATADLRGFGGRLLYLRARHDRLVSARQAALVRELRPDATVAEIDGPHLLMQARTDDCWKQIAAFIEPWVPPHE